MRYIPTPSTKELLAIVCAEDIQPTRILDLCCGSGWLAEALAERFPKAEVWASDIREEEFSTSLKVKWNQGDLFEGLYGKFDLIVCNFPYVPTGLCGDSEPRIAFDGGIDGFDLIERFLAELPKYLPETNYLVAIEIFHAHAEKLPGWRILNDSNDLSRFALLKGRK